MAAILAVATTVVARTRPQASDQTDIVAAGWTWSDIVFAGEVSAVEACPCAYAGGMVETDQNVIYDIEQVFKGSLSEPTVRIAHTILKGTTLVSDIAPCLRTESIHIGARLILFARWDPLRARYVAYHPDFGAIPAMPEVIQILSGFNARCADGISTSAAASSKKLQSRRSHFPEGLLAKLLGPDARIVQSRTSPGGSWTADEASDGLKSEVLIRSVGSECPPVLLSSRGATPSPSEARDDHAGASSVTWMSDQELAFLDSPGSSVGRELVYTYSMRDRIPYAIPVKGRPLELRLDGVKLTCMVRNRSTKREGSVVVIDDVRQVRDGQRQPRVGSFP